MIGDHGRAARKTKRPGDEGRELPSRIIQCTLTGNGVAKTRTLWRERRDAESVLKGYVRDIFASDQRLLLTA